VSAKNITKKQLSILEFPNIFRFLLFGFPVDSPDSHGGVDSCVIAQLGGSWVNYHCEHLVGLSFFRFKIKSSLLTYLFLVHNGAIFIVDYNKECLSN
jgi:hypothetical protein